MEQVRYELVEDQITGQVVVAVIRAVNDNEPVGYMDGDPDA